MCGRPPSAPRTWVRQATRRAITQAREGSHIRCGAFAKLLEDRPPGTGTRDGRARRLPDEVDGQRTQRLALLWETLSGVRCAWARHLNSVRPCPAARATSPARTVRLRVSSGRRTHGPGGGGGTGPGQGPARAQGCRRRWPARRAPAARPTTHGGCCTISHHAPHRGQRPHTALGSGCSHLGPVHARAAPGPVASCPGRARRI